MIIFKIENITNTTNTTTGYLRFRGRYSSWDASYFYDVDEEGLQDLKVTGPVGAEKAISEVQEEIKQIIIGE